jgi:hypothetical protein
MFHDGKAWERLPKGYYLPEAGGRVTSFSAVHGPILASLAGGRAGRAGGEGENSSKWAVLRLA